MTKGGRKNNISITPRAKYEQGTIEHLYLHILKFISELSDVYVRYNFNV